jgi:hypothetical protein
MQPTADLSNQKLTAEAYRKPSIKIDKHQMYPGNPSVGKTSKGGAFIEASEEILQKIQFRNSLQKISGQSFPLHRLCTAQLSQHSLL